MKVAHADVDNRYRVWLDWKEVTERTYAFGGGDEEGVPAPGEVELFHAVQKPGGSWSICLDPDGELRSDWVTGTVKWLRW